MKIDDVMAAAKDSLTVKRVYAEPVERERVTVIAAASVSGGGGGGGGKDKDGGEGTGGGFGMGAKPAGVYVISDGTVRWRPAVDVNRLMTVVGLVTVTALVVGGRIAALRARGH